MKKYTLSIFLFISSFVLVAQQINLTPTTFNTGNLNTIINGSTVNLASGTYNLSDQLILDFAAAVTGKSNVIIQSDGTGEVILRADNQNQQLLSFESCNNLLVDNITLYNVKLQIKLCDNSILNRIKSDYVFFDISGVTNFDDFGKKQSIISLFKGNNNTISNCILNYNNTQLNSKVIKSYRGTNPKFINNDIKGKIQGGYEIWTCETCSEEGINSLYNGYSGALVQGGSVERVNPNSLGGEDHGIYYHDVSNAIIDRVIIKGFTNTGSGGAVKIKNSDHIEIKNSTFYTSGILLRTGSSGWQHCENIWIHNNEIHESIATNGNDFAVSVYMTPNTGYDEPKAIRIEQNKFFNAGFKMKYSEALFNENVEVAGNLPGGFFYNEYGVGRSLNVTAGLNGLNTNCFIGNNCAEGILSNDTFVIDDNPKVYPNPFINEINIDNTFKNIKELKLIDLKGRIILKQSVHQNQENLKIDLNHYNLAKGMYLLNIKMDEGSSTLKLLKR